MVSRDAMPEIDSGSNMGSGMQVVAIEHVQLAMPPGKEDAARGFYQGVLGIPEVPKPRLTLLCSSTAWKS